MVWNIFFLFGGVAAMMLGMKVMGSALEKLAGGGMKKMLGKVTNNTFAGIGVGVAVTSVIQSSTATTVMLVGFVNVGLLTLSQATSVIMGANIGTTVTAHLASLSSVGSIDVGAIAAFIACIAMFTAMIVKSEKIQTISNILVGLGILFIGLEVISTFTKLVMLKDGVPIPIVQKIFQGEHFPLLLILIGIVLTAMVHSSSTITTLMVALAAEGLLSFDNALFLTLGSNIGTCITSLISSIGTSTNAKRTAVVHLVFNLFGCLVMLAPIWIWKDQVAQLFAKMTSDTEKQLAIFHTLFNVVTTILLLPLNKLLVKLTILLVPDKKQVDDQLRLKHLDNLMLQTPPIAVGRIKNEIVRMSQFAKDNLNYSMEMLFDGKVDNSRKIEENEKVLNYLNKSITEYMTKLIGKELSVEDDKKLGSYFHVVSDMERVGDYAENIMEYSLRLRKEELYFSDEAVQELREVLFTLDDLFDVSIQAFDQRNVELLKQVDILEQKVDEYAAMLESKHIERVKKGECQAQIGSIYLQTISNLERVGDHITNLAFSLTHYRHVEKKIPKEI